MKPDFIRKHKKKDFDEGLLLEQEQVTISVRSIVLGLILVALVTYFSARIEILPPRASMGKSHFPWPPVLVMLALIFCVNVPMYFLRKSLRLRSAELLTIFCMTFSTVAIPSYGLMMHLCTRFGGISYIDSRYRESKLVETCGEYVSPLLEPGSRQAATWFYEGIPYKVDKLPWLARMMVWYIPWSEWVGPLCMWLLIVGLVYLLYICLATILSKQWIEHEKLPFAAAQVPLAMVESDKRDRIIGSFLRNKVVWIGFAIPFLMHTYNCLTTLLPDAGLPKIEIIDRAWEGSYLTEAPWSALKPLHPSYFPMGVALIFLISREVSFSLLFFFILLKVQVVIAYYLGMASSQSDFMGGVNYFTGQSAGALAMLAIMGLWIGRAHLKEVFTRAFPQKQTKFVFAGAMLGIAALRLIEWSGVLGLWFTPQMSLFLTVAGLLAVVGFMRKGSADDSREILPYRMVAIGLPLSVYGIARWCEIVGMFFWLAVFIVGILIVFAIAMTRLVAEGGLFHLKTAVDPINMSYTAFGPGGLGPANMTVMSTLKWGLMFEFPAFLLPAVMNCIKIGWDKRCSGRRFGTAIMLAIVLAVLLSFYVYVSTSYERGAIQVYRHVYFSWTHGRWNELCRNIEEAGKEPGLHPDWKAVSYVGMGAAAMFVLCMMRQRFLWFVHPLGYVAWMSPFMMNRLWLPILVGWLLKTLIVKFGGHTAYEKARPFFIGVIAGEAVAVTLWCMAQYLGVDVKVNVFK